MKRICSKTLVTLLAVLMLISALPFAASAATATVNGKEVSVDEIITVAWELDSSIPVVNAEFTVNYPTDLLELVKLEDCVSFPVLSKANLTVNYLDGAVHVTATNASTNDADLYDFKGGADLVTLQFRVKAAGEAKVELDVEFIGGKNPQGIKEDEIPLVEEGKVADGVNLTNRIDGDEPDVPEPTSLIINDGEAEAEVGEYVTYELLITSDYKIVDLQGSVEFDPEYLQLEAIYYPVITNMVSHEKDGLIEFTFTKPEGPYDFSEEGVVVRVVFSVLKNGETDVIGVIDVMDGQNPESTEEDVELIAGGKIVDPSTEVDHQFEVTGEMPEEPFKYGDVNFDGTVDSTDATLVLQHFAEIKEITGIALKAANVDGGYIDSSDATLILQYFAEIISIFPVETA